MQKALLIKSGLVAAILAVLALPLRMIDGLVNERAARQHAMVQELADESYAPQMLAGPILSIPYSEEFDDEATTAPSAMPIAAFLALRACTRRFPNSTRARHCAFPTRSRWASMAPSRSQSSHWPRTIA